MKPEDGVAALPLVSLTDLPDGVTRDGDTLKVSGEVVLRLLAVPALEIVCAENSHLTLIEERYAALDAQVKINLAAGATVQHVLLQQAPETADLTSQLAVRQAAGSLYRTVRINIGGQQVIDAITVELADAAARCELYGLALPQVQQIAHRITVKHQVADTHSEQVFHHLLGDNQSKTEFVGRAVVAKQAQHCVANQSSHNVLLAPLAQAVTAPELEIYADQVQCAHGAVVGTLEQDALFYLRSRGISEREAMLVLASAEAEMIVEKIDDFHAKTAVANLVLQRLNQMIGVN